MKNDMTMEKNNYVLHGCWTDPDKKYTESGYVAFSESKNFELYLTDSMHEAKVYDGDVEDGHGSPSDWAKLIGSEYGLKLTPIKCNF